MSDMARDITKQLDEVTQRTSEPIPTGTYEYREGTDEKLGLLPLTLRHVHNFQAEIRQEIEEKNRELAELVENYARVRKFYSLALHEHFPGTIEAYENTDVSPDWQVIGIPRDGNSDEYECVSLIEETSEL